MEKNIYCAVAIVGAGASGLMAANEAAAAAATVASVVIFERNDRPGVKLSITGKGRCNITNNAEKEQFMLNIPGNGKFLFSAFSKMSNRDIVAFFEKIGVGVALERGGRYFTKNGSAREVTGALVRRAERLGARFIYNARIKDIQICENGGVRASNDGCGVRASGDMEAMHVSGDGCGVHASGDGCGAYRFRLTAHDGRVAYARSVVIATGGIAYPSTGSTGDGYTLAGGLGHAIVAPRPSLTPLETYETWPAELSGLSLRNVTLSLYSRDGKKLFSKLGEMLLTHFGISGPLVLSGSRALLDHGFPGCVARIDLKPGLSDEKLCARITRDFSFYAKKQLINAMADLTPRSLIPVIIREAGLDPNQRADLAGKAGVAKLSEAMKGLKLTIRAARPASEAIATAGGVKTTEINPSTMESKIVPGLYFCGELIDVDAYTGGFNLSIAFATGHVAGKSAAARL